jgi:cysteinyl-tRNA synthetase
LARIKERKAAVLAISPEEIETLIAERSAARKNRDFKRSDEIRDALLDRNIMLLDGAQGTTWTVK